MSRRHLPSSPWRRLLQILGTTLTRAAAATLPNRDQQRSDPVDTGFPSIDRPVFPTLPFQDF